MSGRRRRKTYEDDHLPYPQDFLRPLDPHKLLDRFFVRFDGWPALEVLDKLNAQFGIGGAPPYVAIRPADGERGEMIVIRNSEDDTEKSTGVAAVGLTEAQARLHPTARAELDKYARDKLLRLQARNAPATLRYARVLLWWLGTIKPKSTTPDQDRKRRLTNRRRNVRDPDDAFGVRSSRVKMLIRFFRDRRLATHNYDVGDEFAKWFRDRLLVAGKPMVGGQMEGGQDGTIANYHSSLAQALNTMVRRFQAPIRVGFKRTYYRPNYHQKLATGFSAAEVLRVILFCLGYIWNGDGFAWVWEERNGRPYQKLLRLSGKDLEEHLDTYEPVLRLVVIYVLTGTRLARIQSLGYEPHDYRGWIDFDRGEIIRNGRLAPDYPNKPRLPSKLLPIALCVLRYFRDRDRRRQLREQWDDVEDGGFHIVHDGCGGEVSNLAYRAKNAFDALGIPSRRHDMKAAGVGLFWEAGFDLRRIARITGNDPDTLERAYLFLVQASEGVLRPRPDPARLTFLTFLDPQRRHRSAPRASRPRLPPPEPGAARRA